MDFSLVDIPEAINGKDGKDCNETRINELETKIKDLEDKIAYLNDKIERYLSIAYQRNLANHIALSGRFEE
jgi:hypothetical protein